MDRVEELSAKVEALQQRLSRMSEASMRINESLDLETVLQGVLDSARALTGARYGFMMLYDDKGWVVDYVSSGLTSKQADEFWRMDVGLTFQQHFRSLTGPLRVRDFQRYTRTVGLPEFRPPFPLRSAPPLLSAPIFHRGMRFGEIYLGDRDEESELQIGELEFTLGDEETLVLFASQAALVISNARKHREEQQAREDLETLVNTVPVGVLVFDGETQELASASGEVGRIIRALRISSGSVQELLDTATFRSLDGQEIPQQNLPLTRVLKTRQAVQAEEVVIETPDGRSVTVMVNATPIRDSQGAVESVILTLQDMTPLSELEQMRTEFLGIVGHELRQPLAGIKGSAATLLTGMSSMDPGDVVQYLRIIDEQADFMKDLISDLTDVVRIEKGSLSIKPQPVEMERLLEEACNLYLSAGGREKVGVNLAPDLPAVMADRRRIVQVVNNLLVNAARNSHETSSIRIDAQPDGVYVSVSVADSGRGLPAEQLPHLFQKFSRPYGSDQTRDMGLGLAICKGIVEAHGGRIWAESDGLGQGSQFIFTIPAAESPAAEAASGPAHASSEAKLTAGGDPVRIFAIDDDPRMLNYIRESLTQAGYEPTVTADPRQVALLVEEVDPHLVLLDVMLPGTNGFDLMQDIFASRDTPVIFLSAYDQDDLIAKAVELGAADYIVKPFTSTELDARINAALRNRS